MYVCDKVGRWQEGVALMTSDIKMIVGSIEFAPKLCHLRGQEKHKVYICYRKNMCYSKSKVTNCEPQKSLNFMVLIKDFS